LPSIGLDIDGLHQRNSLCCSVDPGHPPAAPHRSQGFTPDSSTDGKVG